jgi:hypothetical protein
MNNAPQPTQPVDPDMALLFLGSWFEKLLHAPERDDATLDAVAAHIILDERPKTLLGLVITALAEKWLRRSLWMVDFDWLPPSDQGVRVVIDALLRSCPPDRASRRTPPAAVTKTLSQMKQRSSVTISSSGAIF